MNLQAITKENFTQKTWQRPTNFLYSAKDSVCPIVAHELPLATLSMPIGFVLADDVYSLVAVQGLKTDSNFYVDPAGKWLAKYIPSYYRGYPFRLVENSADREQLVLCIDADCGLITEQGGDELFFNEAGEMSEVLAQIFDFLIKVNNSRLATSRICKILQEHNLIKPWEMKIQLDTGIQEVQGLYCIDEPALNNLSDNAFISLRKSGALSAAYCQLLSIRHISDLALIVKSKAKSAAESSAAELYFDSETENGNISFDNI